jgi:hypothetical protein
MPGPETSRHTMRYPYPPARLERRPTPRTLCLIVGSRHVLLATGLLIHIAGWCAALFKTTWSMWKLGREETLTRLAKP